MRPLIYDVGMHNGADTDFYLRKGFDVVAIEANPDHVARARERFAADIAEGRLVIHDVALTETAGEVSFFVHEHDDWSRLDVDLDHRFRRAPIARSAFAGCRSRTSCAAIARRTT